jgi:peptidoglycan/LPS O-acetylase OafA/YrhL
LSKRISFFPGLDALRALAVFMTLGAHYLSRVGWDYIPYLWYGVDIFFGISGFLITGILLRTRQEIADTEKLGSIKNFFIRRALRLFPAYYLFITFFVLARIALHLFLWKPEYTIPFYLYLPNIYFFNLGSFDSGSFSHLWSLGVEEQFYLFWPWLVLYFPVKYLKYLFPSLVLIAIGINVWFHDVKMIRVLPFSNFHTLGIGAWYAYYKFSSPGMTIFQLLEKYRNIIWAGVFTVLLYFLFSSYTVPMAQRFGLEVFLSLTVLMFLVVFCKNDNKVFNAVTRNSAVQFIGKISYGVYLYHMPVPDLLLVVFKKAGYNYDFQNSPLLSLLMITGVTFTIAYFSFRFIEQPFLNLKRKFES